MVEIIKNTNNTLTFVCDGYILPCNLLKVEKVADNSNYYCLWINEKEFYLFNVQNKKHALKINTYTTAKKFCKIEFYSNDSKTFVAYRSDKDYAYILFENGDYENIVFKYVGNEYNGIRPVKVHNDRWGYYNVFKRGFLYDISKGMFLEENEELVQCYNTNCYSIYKKGLYYRFVLFDTNTHKTYYSDKIEYLEETYDNNKIIGKIYGKNIYTLLNKKNPTLPIGYYTSKPRYIAEKNCFTAKRINSFVVISNNKEISNCQWIEDTFVFNNSYILNRTTTGIWKLYRFSDGSEICTDWTNIRFDSDLECIVADTDKGKNQIVGNSDIEKFSKILLEKSKSCFEYITPKVIQQKENEIIVEVTNTKPQSVNKSDIPNVNRYNELPSNIDFIAFIEHIKISQDGYVLSSRAHKMLSVNNHICWIIQDKHIVIISRFLNTKSHKIIYYQEGVESDIFNKKSEKKFLQTNITITNGEDSLYEALSNYEYIPQKETKYNVASNYLPNAVDYCIFVNDLYYDSSGEFEFVQTQNNAEELPLQTFVCWNIKKEQSILISKYIGNNQHQIVYRKMNNIGLLFSRRNCNQFIKTRINITTESALIRKVNNIARQGIIDGDEITKHQIQHQEEEQNLPNIHYCIFVQDLQINSKGRFEYLLNETVAKDSVFCWVVESRKKIVISKNCDIKNHEVLHIIKNNEGLIYSRIRLNEVLHIKMNDVTKQNIISKINKIVGTIYREHNQQMYKLKTEMNKKTNVKKFEYADCLNNIDTNRISRFYFDDIAYEMKANDIWNEPDVFIRRQFVQKRNLIAILLDSTSKAFIENSTIFYEIIGEGKDYRFNQDFNPVNRAIRDNDRRILLFYKSKDGQIRFLEEVVCVGYVFKTDENCEKNVGRKIIVFKLCSSNEKVLHGEYNTAKDEEISKTPILEKVAQIECNSSNETNDSFTTNSINEDNMKEKDIDVFAHLRKLYLTMSNLKELGLKINDDIVNEINRLEEKVVKEELLPSIASKITDTLSPIEREITLVVNYIPNEPIKFGICREHLADTVNVNLLEVECKEDEEQNKERTLHTKSAKSNLRITLPNGRIISHSTAVESLIEFILYIGAEKAQRVGLVRCKMPLISQYKDTKYGNRQKLIGNGLYLMTCTSTEAKKEDIEKIASFYDINVNVEIIQ